MRFAGWDAVHAFTASADDRGAEIAAMNLLSDEGLTHPDHSCQFASGEWLGASQQVG